MGRNMTPHKLHNLLLIKMLVSRLANVWNYGLLKDSGLHFCLVDFILPVRVVAASVGLFPVDYACRCAGFVW